MKQLLFILFIISTLSFSALAQTINLQIKGIEIGSSYTRVLRSLGKPLSSKKGGVVPCSDGSTLLTLRYAGLIIELSKDENERNFSVFRIEVTSPKWLVSGVRVGASIANVRAKFGFKKLAKDNGLEYLPYFITDGYAGFYFRNKKLVKTAWEFNFC